MRRTYGVENEYGVELALPYGPDDPWTIGQNIFPEDWNSISNDLLGTICWAFSRAETSHVLPEGIKGLRHFFSNGAKMYLDIGYHPEYSAAEAFSPLGAVLNEFSGIEFMRRVCEGIRKRGPEIWDERESYSRVGDRRPIFKLDPRYGLPFRLTRSVTDGQGITWGHHLNFSVDPTLRMNEEALAPLLLAKIGSVVLFGGGYVGQDGEFYGFQKGPSIRTYINNSTTLEKPFISPRDEPHADSRKAQRLHDVGNDPLHSPYASWLRLGLEELCIAVCEDGLAAQGRFVDMLPENPQGLLMNVGKDIYGDSSMQLADGTTTNGIGILEMIQELIENNRQRLDFSPEKNDRQLVFDELEVAIQALRTRSSRLTELFDVHRRNQLYQDLRDRSTMSPAKLFTLMHYMNDISGVVPSKITHLMQEHLRGHGWQRLAHIYGINDAVLRSVANDPIGAPVGRPQARAREIGEANPEQFYVDWHMWGIFDEALRQYQPDMEIPTTYDPLAREVIAITQYTNERDVEGVREETPRAS